MSVVAVMTKEEADASCRANCHPSHECPYCEHCETAHCSLNASAHIAYGWFGEGTEAEIAARKEILYKRFAV